MKRIFNLSALLCLLGKCSKPKVDNSVVNNFDLNVFLGNWYEIARFDHRFERGLQQTKANYTLLANGKVRVLNTGIKKGKHSEAKGIAKQTGTPGLLRVSFWRPFFSDYRIMLLDSNYQYALVGSKSDDYLWILSRSPQISSEIKTLILSEARRRGYDTDKLIWVKQQ
ncbi:MAG: lipocalin family protein [Muribaculaceae bacterium]|nr:lipocalin family protein [Muribaculaceae bacterium]